MSSGLRALRRRILTPNFRETKPEVRGFHQKSPEASALLERVGTTFLTGYAYAVESRSVEEAEDKLELLEDRWRGFAYEGAGMGFAMLDGLPFGGGGRVDALLNGRGRRHIYMVIVGVGWAMARLPKARWAAIDVEDPLLRFLVLDGYGFHQAYFKTEKYVHQQYQHPNFPWPGDSQDWYSDPALDQGIGRALWFVGGTDPAEVTTLINRFPRERRANLYSGAGLAATYAGGVTGEELTWFREAAGEYAPAVAQGSAFAATCRIEAGLIVPHTDLATAVFCDLSAEEAAALSYETRPVPPFDFDVPAYETWRRTLSARFAQTLQRDF
jgi:enediyne biosynthesis protein E3